MKEASVAGESPDKSEQRKSSGGTAPGERDPRLAVLREPAGSAEPAAEPEPEGRVRVDQPTAVFKMPTKTEPEEPQAPEEAGEVSAEAEETPGKGPGEALEAPESAPDAPGAPEGPGAPPGAPEGDARLRAAVAAWVATGDPGDRDPSGAAPAADGDAAEGKDEGKDKTEAGAEARDGAEAEVEVEAGAGVHDAEAVEAEEAEEAEEAGKAEKAEEAVAAPDADEPSAEGDAPVGADGDGPTADSPESGKSDTPVKPDEAGASEPVERDRAPEGAKGGSDGGVDQATAVFKAVRPRQAVDQPTTALKTVSRPESATERTSQFVPLKPDTVRPPAGKPRSAPAAPAASAASAAPAASTAPAPLPEAERTRQQPLPPRPPLDLLAELTNTPPPPETPVRTAVRRVKIWTPLLLLVVIVFATVQAVRPLPAPALVLSAEPTYTFGGGRIDMPWPAEGQGAVEVEGVGTIGTYGRTKVAPIASMAKVMTAYVILKNHPITGDQVGEKIEVDKRAADEAALVNESKVPVKEGQKYTQREMLMMLMIPSGNNAARLLARWDASTEDAFVDKMNAAAKDLGMTNSTYTDPSGLKASTVSTPADQLKLAKAVMQNDVFREVVNMPQADIPTLGETIYNNNHILLEPGVSGIKTGSSTPAGGNLVWTADTIVDGKSRRIIGVVMGADAGGTLDEKLERARQNSLKLIQAAQKGVESATVVKKGDVVGYVDDGLGGRTPVVSTKDLKPVGWGGLRVELDLGDGGEPVPHSAKAGTVVGEVTVGTGTGKVTAPVALRGELTEPAFGDKLTRVG
ncbi:D-alanyl-D-alanine carboxypeptidase [Streptomyces enissocaesilis]